MMDIFELITQAKDRNGSDLHMVVDSPPLVRVRGALEPLDGATPLTPQDNIAALSQLAEPRDLETFQRELELDFGFTMPGVGRLRCNAAQQRGAVSLAIRLLPPDIPTIDELELPQICKDLVMRPRGLVVVTGPTGSGKSTTLGAMIQHLNHNAAKHVVTIEDPIEYVHPSLRCAITQRQLGTDTRSFSQALKHVLRQNPDVIMVGEMRDLETAAAVLTVAETGHLVLTTSHAPSTHQALERIIDLFPPHERHLAYTRLASLLMGVLCQTLVPRAATNGRIAAVEIMLANTAVRNLIREEKLYQVPNVVRTSRDEGMLTLDESLVDLYKHEKITRETVYDYCADTEEIERLLGARPRAAAKRRTAGGGGMYACFIE
ncbi:PilT/PilU family type 4a pilus ATPase [Dehalogenimonas sp. 4OHTPN]|uniref:PilT/PilU family type 4a pilus ATPase n=1 Tax=Dehalogenimonas sp. 4OHTPN TaxID=3166643 RepID=A0AAU8GBS1_9CHLR